MTISERLRSVRSKVHYPLPQERAAFHILRKLARNRRETAGLLRALLQPRAAGLVPGGSRHRDITLRVQGTTYVVALHAAEIYILEELYLYHFYDMVADFVPKAGWTVFDIGANVGLFAIQQALRGAHVYAFEPNRDCYRRLSRAVVANGLAESITTFNDAVGVVPGLGVMEVPGGETTCGVVRPIGDLTSAGGPAVPITSLDHIVPSLQVEQIDLLKIDVEGAEVDVLRGAASTLGKVERIIVEYHSQDLRAQVGGYLTDSGFSHVLQVGMDVLLSMPNGSRWSDQGIIYASRSAFAGEQPGHTAVQ